MHIAELSIGWLFLALSLAGAAYTLLAASAVGRFASSRQPAAQALPSVTLLKPLHFDAPDVEADLETFLAQDYPAPIQVVFGVQHVSDPVIAVVERLIARHPGIDMELVLDARRYGSNAKICNLINMAERAKHGVLVLSDSDIAVPPDYLRRVVGALLQPGVGAVTCPYTGKAGANAWSKLGAMGTSYDFLPNLVFGTRWGIANACLGSTIALRRETLGQIGGFEAFSNYLADDYEIGRAIRDRGQNVSVLPLAVSHRVTEVTAQALFSHELRWSRTVRLVRPWSFAGTIVTFPVPVALFAMLFLGFGPWALGTLAMALIARLALRGQVERVFAAAAGPVWLLPVRDTMSFMVFLGSFFSQKVAWRGSRFQVQASGAMSQI